MRGGVRAAQGLLGQRHREMGGDLGARPGGGFMGGAALSLLSGPCRGLREALPPDPAGPHCGLWTELDPPVSLRPWL